MSEIAIPEKRDEINKMDNGDIFRHVPTKTVPSNLTAFMPTSFTYLPLSTQATLLFTALVLLVIAARDFFWPKDETYGLPVFEIGNVADCRAAVAEGDLQCPNSPYILKTPEKFVILPNSDIHKCGSMPEDQLSAMKDVYRRALGQYTDLGTPLPEMFAAIKVDLTRHVRDFVPILQEEVEYCFEKLIPSKVDTGDWQPFTVFTTIKRMVAILSACTFIGPPLSRDEEWIEIMYSYSDDIKNTHLSLIRFPSWIRPYLHPFLFRSMEIHKTRKRIEDKIQPLLEQNLRDNKAWNRPKTQKTLWDWVRERLGGGENSPRAHDITLLARIQIRAALASMDTVAHCVTNVIYDLAAYPEYVQVLREEVEAAVGGIDNPTWPKSAPEKMDKLDSFIKESMRMSPMYLLAMTRTVTSPLPLENGKVLPTGSRIAFSQQAAHFSSERQHNTNPNVFDGFRYSKLREKEGDGASNKYLFVSTGDNHVTFGHGRDSCPGRHYAVTEIKILLAYLLLNYDVKLRPGTKRPKCVFYNKTVGLDRSAELLIRKRQVK